MLNKIRLFFESRMNVRETDSLEEKEKGIQLATAALLIELINADTEIDRLEWESVKDALQQTFVLDNKALQELISLAQVTVIESTDLYQFTQLINKHYEYRDKLTLLECMWRVAHADGRIDKFEEHLIRKIAGLIHVAHADFIRAKQKSRN
ncbi:MAG: TerB family tellurite resistance protein [Gammaproteobacteria bacterium]|nr:TerB family tellurite resistance protein [Gammaproteobacteria bacterium]